MKQLDFLVNLLMPKRCTFCSKVIGFLPECDSCSSQLVKLKRYTGSEINLQPLQAENIKAAYAPFIYSGCVRDGILSMKFNNSADKAKDFAFFMAQALKTCNVYEKFDIIIAVPSSKGAMRRRGYDVPHLLAKELSKLTKIPYLKGALSKQFETAKQATLSAQQRKANIIGAFEQKQGLDLSDKNVLLIDDIITTGSTLNECAKVLLFANAKSVYAACIAETLSDSKKE